MSDKVSIRCKSVCYGPSSGLPSRSSAVLEVSLGNIPTLSPDGILTCAVAPYGPTAGVQHRHRMLVCQMLAGSPGIEAARPARRVQRFEAGGANTIY